MTNKHTPGPWGRAGKDIVAPPLDEKLLTADPHDFVTLVARCETEKDAALIVEAPELLKILKASLKWMESGLAADMSIACSNAREVITRIEGEENNNEMD